MKKHTAGLALAAVTGFSILSATPAFAMATPYPNCAAAAADGLYNIPDGDPRYAPGLDRDNDGLACDGPGGTPSIPVPTDPPTAPPTEPPATPTNSPSPQVTDVPRGGVDAGVATDPGGPPTGALALTGGLVVAAAGAGTYVIRRRHGNHA